MDETEGSLIPYREWSNEVNQIFVSQNLCSYKNIEFIQQMIQQMLQDK